MWYTPPGIYVALPESIWMIRAEFGKHTYWVSTYVFRSLLNGDVNELDCMAQNFMVIMSNELGRKWLRYNVTYCPDNEMGSRAKTTKISRWEYTVSKSRFELGNFLIQGICWTLISCLIVVILTAKCPEFNKGADVAATNSTNAILVVNRLYWIACLRWLEICKCPHSDGF